MLAKPLEFGKNMVRWVTRPHSSVTSREERERSTLLSALQFSVVLVTILILTFVVVLDPRDLQRPDTQAGFVFLLLTAILYVFTRMGYIKWTAMLFIILTTLIFTVPAYLAGAGQELLAFAVAPILLAGLFYSLRHVVAVSMFIVVLVYILNRAVPDIDFWGYQYIWYFLVFASGLVITLVWHMNTVEKIRREELEEANRKLRDSEEMLEQRVKHRTSMLQEAVEKVTALNKIKDEFVSNVSHELRTPITSIKVQSMILDKLSVDEQRKHLDTLNREINRLEALIEALLLLSRLDQNRVEINLKPVDLTQIASEYVNDRTALAASKGITLTLNGEDSPVEAIADYDLIGQVLSILLTNAINYTPNGGEISIETLAVQGTNVHVSGFRVRDNGPGISQEDQAQLFTRFFRGKAAHESRIGGTGLGLAISKEIIDQHGGQIEVESTGIPGEGTAFTVWLTASKTAVQAGTVQRETA